MCCRDAIMINIVSFFTSVYAGFAVFSIIGYMADQYDMEVDKIIDSGPGLAFIVYPRALSLMPLAPLWSGLFFFMLFLLGVGSQVSARSLDASPARRVTLSRALRVTAHIINYDLY